MKPRPRHLTKTAAVTAGLALLLPGLATAAHADAPSHPTEVSASGGYRSVTVAFTPPAADGGSRITGYQVQVRDGAAWRRLAVRAAGDELVGTVAGLKDGTRYTPSVRALNADGASAPSPGSPARTHGRPTQPGQTYLVPGDRAIRLVDQTDHAEEGQGNSFRLVADAVPRGVPTRTLLCRASTCDLTGLRNGVTYRVSVTPVNVYRVQGRTVRFVGATEKRGTLVPWNGPQAPIDVRVQPDKQSAYLSWTIGLYGGQRVRDFEVSVDGAWRPVDAVDDRAVLTGLRDGRTYTLRVRGTSPYDGAPGLPSAPVKVTPGPQG